MVHTFGPLAAALTAAAGPIQPVFVTPDDPSALVGQAVTYTLERASLGEHAAPRPIPWDSAPLDTGFLRAGNTQVNADAITQFLPPDAPQSRAGTTPTIDIILHHPGTNLLGIDLRPWTQAVDVADLRAQLRGRIAPAAMARLDAALPEAGDVVVHRLDSAKAFVEVRPLAEPDAATATSKSGQPAEIRLLMNPGLLKPGSDLPIRVYAAGDKQEGAVVVARVEAAPGLPGATQSCTTDGVGIGYLHLPRAGLYRVEFLHAEPAGEETPSPDAVVYAAIATFFVHEDGRPPEPPAGAPAPQEPRR